MDIQTVDTWLPVFSGFYGTIWEADNDQEIELENLNEQRQTKGLKSLEWDDVKWNYKEYQKDVVVGITSVVETDLQKLGLIIKCQLQKLVSPKEYNFANDSINVEISLTKQNVLNIGKYLTIHDEAFITYLKDKYTSRSGFISFHSNDIEAWVGENLGDTLANGHQLGSVLNFILLNEDPDMEMDIYEDYTIMGFI